jgi:hypothetical protein
VGRVSAIWMLPASKNRHTLGRNNVGVATGPNGRMRAREAYRAMRMAGVDVWNARRYVVVLLAVRADVVCMADLT